MNTKAFLKSFFVMTIILSFTSGLSAQTGGSTTSHYDPNPPPTHWRNPDEFKWLGSISKAELPPLLGMFTNVFKKDMTKDEFCKDLTSVLGNRFIPDSCVDHAMGKARTSLREMCEYIARLKGTINSVFFIKSTRCVLTTYWEGFFNGEIPKEPEPFEKFCKDLPDFTTEPGLDAHDDPSIVFHFKPPEAAEKLCGFNLATMLKCEDVFAE